MVEKDNTLSSFKVHGIVPEKKCTGESLWDLSYIGVIDQSGGSRQDPCSTTDYSTFLMDMVENAMKIDSPVFALTMPADDIIEVSISGQPTTEYTLSNDGTVLTIPALINQETEVSIEVIYSPK
jgi:hypothetical protein